MMGGDGGYITQTLIDKWSWLVCWSAVTFLYFEYVLGPVRVTGGDRDQWVFRVYPGFMGRNPESKLAVITQGDAVNVLCHLPLLMEHWEGAINIAMYVDDHKMLMHWLCSIKTIVQTRENVGVQLVVSQDLSSAFVTAAVNNLQNCPRITLTATQYCDSRRVNYDESSEIPYAANVMRNIGREYSNADFHLVVDIDVIPNRGSYATLLYLLTYDLYDEDAESVAFVLPIFEIQSSYCTEHRLPQTKQQVNELMEKGDARVFYTELNKHIHSSTRSGQWLTNNQTTDRVSFWVQWQDPYEPFFVQHKSTPFYPTQFVGYGSNRLSQIYLLDQKGTAFGVLQDCFLVHCGFKTQKTLSSAKLYQLQHNKILYGKLKLKMTE